MIEFVEVREGGGFINAYLVKIKDKILATLEKCDDGFFNMFLTNYSGGYLTEDFLRTIADKLKELNKEWKEQIEQDFGDDK